MTEWLAAIRQAWCGLFGWGDAIPAACCAAVWFGTDCLQTAGVVVFIAWFGYSFGTWLVGRKDEE